MRAVARLGLALGLALWCGWAEAAQWLKQSTAVTVVVGPFVDSTDAVTAETGLTISQADVQLSKNGGAYAQKNDATSASHMTSGRYSVPLNATDTGTLGVLRLDINESGALPVWATYMVVPANVYDSLVGGSDYLQADMTQVEGSDATDYIEGRTLAAASYFDFSTDSVTVGTNSDKTGYSISGTITTLDALDTAQDAQHSQTQSDIAGLNNISTAQVNAEVDTALADYDAPTKAELDAGFAGLNDPTAGAIADAVWIEALADHKGTAGSTAEALDGATAPTASAVADAVWTALLSSYTTAGSAGKVLSDAGAGAGDGDTEVDHDTGGTDNLAYRTSGGAGIDNAVVRAYVTTEFDAGTYTLRGRTTTDSNGRWVSPLYLNSGVTYTISFFKEGAYGPDYEEVTIP